MTARVYIAIDLKSFYASVECVERGLDPLTTNLVVADESRTEKTICLAVSPSLKACGIPGRARLFEVVQKVREVNARRRRFMLGRCFTGKSSNAPELKSNPALELDYIVAMPRMARYMEVSAQIYGLYLKFVSPDDIHVYSIDEVFIDATQYLRLYKLTAREFAMKLIQEVLKVTGITATAGIGTWDREYLVVTEQEAAELEAARKKYRIWRKRRSAFFSSSSLQKERSEKVLHIVVAIVVMRRVFPILQRGHAVKFLEFPAEIVRIRIAGLVCNLTDVAIWIHAQKLTSVVHPHFRQIPGDRHLKEKTEKLHQPRPAYIGIPDDLRHRERRIVVLLNEFNRPEQRRRIPGDPDVVLDMTLQAQNQKIGQRLHRINHVFPRQLLNVGKPVGNDRIPRNVNLPETVQ